MKTRLDPEGRIQLPDALQTQLGVKPGDDLFVERQDAQWVICAEGGTAALGWEENVLVHRGASAEPPDVCLARAREERLDRLSEDVGG